MKALTIIFTLLIAITSVNAQRRRGRGFIINDSLYNQIIRQAPTRALTALPESYSLKDYAPDPADQDEYNTCTAWAGVYCAGTIVAAIRNHSKNHKDISNMAFSATYAYHMAHRQDCDEPLAFNAVLEVMKNQGAATIPDTGTKCVPPGNKIERMAVAAANTGYSSLFYTNDTANVKILGVKDAIANNHPVIIGVHEVNSLLKAFDTELWHPTEVVNGQDVHAMCVIGYDNTKYGGAFEIQNSWGRRWGKGGRIWLTYKDFSKYVFYACQLRDSKRARDADGQDSFAGKIQLVLADGNEMPVVLQDSSASRPVITYASVNNYKGGTDFQFLLSNDEPAYIYAISADLVSLAKRIFPGDGISPYLDYKESAVVFPGEDSFVEFDKVPGTDYLCFFYSKTELDIDDIIKKIQWADGNFCQRVYKVMGENMVNASKLNLGANNINFTGKSAGKDYAAIIVELNHIQ